MEAVIFCGIPASGKTSFYRERFFDTHVRISLDLLKTRQRENMLLYACLAAQQPFVVDNTNVTVEARAHYLRLAKAAGFKCVAYFLETSSRDAVGRNRGRPENQRVPNVAIFGSLKKLRPPTPEEGFDAIYVVTLNDGGFDVSDTS